MEKLKANLHDQTVYVIHIRNLKHALNHRKVRILNKYIDRILN